MIRNVLISAVLLSLFGLIGATLVATVHQGTQARIQANRDDVTLERLHEILPEGAYDNAIVKDTVRLSDPLLGGEDRRVYRARQDGRPVAAVFSVVTHDGYAGDIRLLVGVLADGRIAGVRVVNHQETPGLGDDIEAAKSDWIRGFEERALGDPPREEWAVRSDGGVFDQFTGATITPRAVVEAVRDTLIYFRGHRDQVFAAPEEPSGEAS
ncbi:MAG: electron transport complex subunit RsxG [Ectothiorhodospira sp.]